MSPAQTTSTTSSSDADVPQRLVMTAIAEFGARGTQAVSGREIQRKAGVLNEAAVRYYFKNRHGLVDACLAHIIAEFDPIIDEAWSELAALKQDNALTVKAVVKALVVAFYAYWQQHTAGVQLVARLIREEGEVGQDMLIRRFGHVIWRFEDELSALLPDKPAQTLRLHSFLAINNIVNGMVDQTLLWQLPGTQPQQTHFSMSQENLAQGFIDYVSAGLCSIP